jgi:hypothetical protein
VLCYISGQCFSGCQTGQSHARFSALWTINCFYIRNIQGVLSRKGERRFWRVHVRHILFSGCFGWRSMVGLSLLVIQPPLGPNSINECGGKKNSGALVRQRTIPTERPLLVGEVTRSYSENDLPPPPGTTLCTTNSSWTILGPSVDPVLRSRRLTFWAGYNVAKFFFISCRGVRVSLLGTSATNWPIVPAPNDRRWVWSSRWNENWQGKPKYSEKTRPSTTLSKNPIWPDVGSNQGRLCGKPATNRLSYGTATKVGCFRFNSCLLSSSVFTVQSHGYSRGRMALISVWIIKGIWSTWYCYVVGWSGIVSKQN